MSLDSSAAKLVVAMHGVTNHALSKEVASVVKTHSWIGAFTMAVPLFGLETLGYVFTLWHMYSSLSDKARVPFWKNFFSNLLVGFIINVLVCIFFGFLLDFIPFAGWIGSALVGYFSMSVSGCAYLEGLAAMHGENRVKERFNTTAAINYLSQTTTDNQQQINRQD